jgi:TRAP-type C4-dicarboxylate transport system permease small subunit
MSDHPVGSMERVSEVISNILVHISMGMLLVMMLLGFADVFGRYLLNKPIIGTLETFEILLPGVVLFSLAYAQRVKAHIAMDIFYARFPTPMRRIVGICIHVWAIFFFAVVTWRSTLIAILHWNTGRQISNLSVPIYMIDLFVPVGTFAIFLVLISELLLSLAEMKKGV